LTSGQLPIAFYDLSWKDFQKLFNDLVKEKDDFLIRLFRKNKNPKNMNYYLKYLDNIRMKRYLKLY